ncbi:helix-turn-helix domain-containing protein [Corynebacterium tuberculostearicum]|uniref:Helix-turn-helix domain-containing protein n=1 Tax=Corynebacterium tuberculostearicum TaxID=38304 RepID=A0AAE4SVQ5_9CORY|nr:helix-turn-helix domain-containing protein [Corynebacterium tuberculostearicum]MDV2418324.1 helix-turn-helix domain-containing protein [Corynebacterium tuberculostearicum]
MRFRHANFSPDQELFTTKEAAQYLHCSPRTLEKRRTNGQEPAFIKDAWSVKDRRADLDAFIASTGNFVHGSLSDDAVVAKIVAAAPSFSEEQRQQLLAVLGGAA